MMLLMDPVTMVQMNKETAEHEDQEALNLTKQMTRGDDGVPPFPSFYASAWIESNACVSQL
jgi:hypothetical protein